jgi:hypothetical protein
MNLLRPFVGPRHSWREGQSQAAARKTEARRGSLGKEAVKTLRGVGTEIKELAKGIPKTLSKQKTLRQVIRRASRKAWKVQTGRIARK